MSFSELVFYEGNGFTCFRCVDRLTQNQMIYGNNETGNFRVKNHKDISGIRRIELESYVNKEAAKRGIAI